MYYIYNDNSVITVSQSTVPESGTYCISDVAFDFDLYTVTVEAVDANKNLTRYKKTAKPAEQLAAVIAKLKGQSILTQSALSATQIRINKKLGV